VQAIGHEGDEDVGFDPLLQLVVDRAQPEIVNSRAIMTP
jgi:hypothetical protein